MYRPPTSTWCQCLNQIITAIQVVQQSVQSGCTAWNLYWHRLSVLTKKYASQSQFLRVTWSRKVVQLTFQIALPSFLSNLLRCSRPLGHTHGLRHSGEPHRLIRIEYARTCFAAVQRSRIPEDQISRLHCKDLFAPTNVPFPWPKLKRFHRRPMDHQHRAW